MITKKQKQVLDYLTNYQKRNGYAPILEEIRKKFKLASVSTAHFHISKLRDLGYLSKEENKPRAISVLINEPMVKIPLDNCEATLKKFYKERGHIRLQPANKNMKPLIFRNGRDISIQGIVLDVIRDSGSATPIVIYPDARLLNRERKVKNRELKERIRGGTKFQKEAVVVVQADGIEKFTNKIICGDSEEVLRKIPTGSVDIIIFPPYRFRLNYRDNARKVYRSEYFKK